MTKYRNNLSEFYTQMIKFGRCFGHAGQCVKIENNGQREKGAERERVLRLHHLEMKKEKTKRTPLTRFFSHSKSTLSLTVQNTKPFINV